MIKLKLIVLAGTVLYSMGSHALSPDAVEGKNLFYACNACHDQAMDPPLAPPMWGVQRRYKKHTSDGEEFITTMVDFVKAPTREKAIHGEAVEQLGLMPPMPLPDEVLRKIATYILEEKFPPPCDHWTIATKRAEERGDMDHAKKDAEMRKKFCK